MRPAPPPSSPVTWPTSCRPSRREPDTSQSRTPACASQQPLARKATAPCRRRDNCATIAVESTSWRPGSIRLASLTLDEWEEVTRMSFHSHHHRWGHRMARQHHHEDQRADGANCEHRRRRRGLGARPLGGGGPRHRGVRLDGQLHHLARRRGHPDRDPGRDGRLQVGYCPRLLGSRTEDSQSRTSSPADGASRAERCQAVRAPDSRSRVPGTRPLGPPRLTERHEVRVLTGAHEPSIGGGPCRRVVEVSVALAPRAASVRVWQVTSRCRDPRIGRPPPEGARVAHA